MKVIGQNRFTWKDLDLYLDGKKIGSLVEHKIHKGMFYLKWLDGQQSDDFYNLSHAKHNLVKWELKRRNIQNETLHPI